MLDLGALNSLFVEGWDIAGAMRAGLRGSQT
jgi:hypothetical protein